MDLDNVVELAVGPRENEALKLYQDGTSGNGLWKHGRNRARGFSYVQLLCFVDVTSDMLK